MLHISSAHALNISASSAVLNPLPTAPDLQGVQVDFLINRLSALEEHMKAVEEQMALELDHRQGSGNLNCPHDPQAVI